MEDTTRKSPGALGAVDGGSKSRSERGILVYDNQRLVWLHAPTHNMPVVQRESERQLLT